MTRQRSERERLIAAAEDELGSGRRFALATIVGTRGSTYRRAGARLLVREDGTWEGNISGGCLEGEVVDVGARVIDRDEPELVSYDLTADEEAIWGWGLGCNGAIDVLVEPGAQAAVAIRLLEEAAASDRSCALVTVTASEVPRLPMAHHELVDAAEEGASAAVAAAARDVLRAGRSERREVTLDDGRVEVLVEVLRPRLRLLVCGAGHDAIPVVRFARELGWEPVVVDDRSSFLTRERFPDAEDFVHTRPDEAASAAGIRERTAVVVMSHNFLRDVDYLGSFLGTDVDYLGMLGPSQRLERLLDQLAERDLRPSATDRERLHGPAGLDLGAEGPEEIAWSICAEILAVDRGRDGGPLSERPGPIHPRSSAASGGGG